MESYSNNLEEAAQPKEPTESVTQSDASADIVKRHLNAFLNSELDVLMSDYTNKSVLITQEATYTGLEEIKAFFDALSVHFPKQKSHLQLDNLTASNDLVYIVWHAKTPSLDVPIGSDTFIIKGGKIHQQTFAGQLNFVN